MDTISVNSIAKTLTYQSYDLQQHKSVSPMAAPAQHITLVDYHFNNYPIGQQAQTHSMTFPAC
jgi:hypothetical protein